MQKIYLPAYRHFECLADNCTENCCKVFRILFFKWEKEQLCKKPAWQDVDGRGTALSNYIENSGDVCCLRKNESGHCFFLTDKRLCGLQLKYGQDALPSVCRTFPRLITRLPDRTEYALDTCCVQVLRLLKDWTPGDFETVGDGTPEDEAFIIRKRAMALLSDYSLDIDYIVGEIGNLYEFEWQHRTFQFDELQTDFLRKAIAATIWAYALPYFGHHNHPKSMVAIMEFLSEYLDHLSGSDISDWDGLPVDFSRGLSDFVKRVKFDDEIEARYIDVSQD